ncbi:hypothetical protein JB92DRAFT_3137658 [Gautieria morchelliformis]|nr:hypothetical protein JB92DRAFT_3137658 [Gautieria morchelliformis]
MYLMDHEGAEDPFPLPPLPNQIEHYIQGNSSSGPSTANFVIDLDNTSATLWNTKVIQVFTDDFVKSEWYKCKDKSEIPKQFKVHMDYLIVTYKKQMKEAGSDIAVAYHLSLAAHRRRKPQACTNTSRP